MTDVEKYGVFALVFVLGVLGMMLWGDGAEDELPLANPAGHSVIIRRAGDVPLATASDSRRASGGNRRRPEAERPAATYRVRSPVEGVGSFQFQEAPVRYPGEHSTVGQAGRDGTVVHVVRSGETLSGIAKKYLGKASRFNELLALNPGLKPKDLRPGDKIVVASAPSIKRNSAVPSSSRQAPREAPRKQTAAPSRKAPRKETRTTPRTYVVKAGDTLGSIAQKMLGSATQVDALFEANRHVLKSPHDLAVGQELTIP